MMPSESEKDLLRLNGKKPSERREPSPGRRSVRPRKPIFTAANLLRAGGGLIVAAIVFYGMTWALRPHCEAWLIEREMPRLEELKRDALRQKKDLEWQVRYAQSEQGARNLSRDYGYLEEGEVLVLVPGREKLTQKLATDPREEDGIWDRFMLLMCRVCRAGPEVVSSTPPAKES